MNWFRENKFLGGLLIAFVIGTGAAIYFLLNEKGEFDDATVRYNETATELNRLQHLTPFPDEANYGKMKVQAEEYGAAISKLKDDLKMRVLPAAPLAPNEFQTRLRQAVATIAEKARATKVKLPDNFYLGFNEFTSALPTTAAAPLLGQQLDQVTLIANMLLDAHVDSIVAFRRTPLSEETGATPTPTPAAPLPGARKPTAQNPAATTKLVEHSNVQTTFVSTPAASRKILNQLASAPGQFFVVRTLHVRNEKDKGPSREKTVEATPTTPSDTAPAAGDKQAPAGANLNFIVGTEKVQTAANIELVRFTF